MNQYPITPGGRWWPVEGLRKQQCPHQPTAGVGQGVLFRHLELFDNIGQRLQHDGPGQLQYEPQRLPSHARE
jgi:hypothetical protein